MKLRLRRSEAEAWLGCSVYQGEGSTAASFGSLMHEVIEHYTDSCRAAASPTSLDAIDAIVKDVFASGHWNVDPGREAEAVSLMWKFAYTHVADLETLWGTEQAIEVDTPIATLYGTLDRLDVVLGTPESPRLVRVTDWKTSWGLPEKSHPSFQMMYYAGLLVANRPTIDAVECVVDHIRRTDGIARFMLQRDEIETWWASMLDKLALALERRAAGAEPTGGASCMYCKWNRDCSEATRDAREAITTLEEATAEADAYVRQEQSVKARKTALKGWVDEHGPVALPGLLVGIFDGASTEEDVMGGRPMFRTKKVPLIAVESFEVSTS
jgi:hypothetical protein